MSITGSSMATKRTTVGRQSAQCIGKRTVSTVSPVGEVSTGFANQVSAAATSVLRLYAATISARPAAGMSNEPVLFPAPPVLLTAVPSTPLGPGAAAGLPLGTPLPSD